MKTSPFSIVQARKEMQRRASRTNLIFFVERHEEIITASLCFLSIMAMTLLACVASL